MIKPIAGIYPNIEAADYHASEFFSCSKAKQLLADGPAKFRWAMLNNIRRHSLAFDIGTAAHLVLQPDKWDSQVLVVDADDWRTKAAKEEKAIAYATGRTPLLAKQAGSVRAMQARLLSHPVAGRLLASGQGEVTIIAKHETGIWLKSRLDWLTDDNGPVILDYKTTENANPEAFAKSCWNSGYYMQEPWYCDIYQQSTGRKPRFVFIVQETAPPYEIALYCLDESDADLGRRQNRRAIHLFAECLAADSWRGYGDQPQLVTLPNYAHYQLADMEGCGMLDAKELSPQTRAALAEKQAGEAMSEQTRDAFYGQ